MTPNWNKFLDQETIDELHSEFRQRLFMKCLFVTLTRLASSDGQFFIITRMSMDDSYETIWNSISFEVTTGNESEFYFVNPEFSDDLSQKPKAIAEHLIFGKDIMPASLRKHLDAVQSLIDRAITEIYE